MSSVSCSGVGSCAAGGFYEDGSAQFQGFVVSEKNGTWAAAQDVPGLGTLNVGGFAQVTVVSCSPAGSCAAGGFYHTGPSEVQPFVVTRPSGTWGTASPVKGVLALNAGQDAFITSLSCASGGNCSAAGSYTDSLGHGWPFVVSEKNAKWGTAVQAPGVSKLSGVGRFGEINSVSCASPGNCAAAGQYDNFASHSQAFVMTQHNGTWSAAVNVPGQSALDKDHSSFAAVVSCHAPAGCTATGAYHDASGRQETFVLTTK
ncbi:MAG TPA: hypothetical protein VFI65_13125 [Streptosporangiaceae bacterium]|nr:hypothetical protein [Streptosporangiaceae bacterium]